MMDTCADFYNSLSGNSTTTTHASITPKSGVDDHHAAVENLSSNNSSNIHPLLQHNTHPQHLIAPVAPQLVVPPPSAIVAPTITTNHHPQQPTKFTHNGATGYSTSSAAGAQQSSSVVHGTSTGNISSSGGQLQATVYPIQHQPPKNLSPAASPLESLKASVITENPFEAYHHHQQQQQQLNQIQGNYGDSANAWSSSVNRNNSVDHHSTVGGGSAGYLDPSRNSYSGNLSSNCALLNSNEYNNLNAPYSENVGYASSNNNNNAGYPNQSFGGTIGVGFASTPSNLSQSEGQSAIDYQTNQGSGTKCTYNNSSSPVISNQTATSPFQYNNNNNNNAGTIPLTSFSSNSNSTGSNTGAMLQGLSNGSVSSSSSRSVNYNTLNSQMRSNSNHHSSSYDLTGPPMDYQTHQHYQVPNGHSVDLPRTYLDLSATSKTATNHPYYPTPQSHVVAPPPQQKSRRFEDPASQYIDPNYAYNVGQMSMHANQLSRSASSSSSGSHYNRSSAGQGVPQIDPKYRRSSSGSGFSVYKGDGGGALKVPPHLSYHHPHHHPQYGSYTTTDPMTGKRMVNYPPTTQQHQAISNGYSEQIYADLESAKKKAGYPGKYPYSYISSLHPPTAGAGQYGLMGTNIPSGTMQRPNYYPNGFYSAHQPPTAVMNGYTGASYYPSAMNPQPPAGAAPPADYYGHSNFIKSHSSAHGVGPKSTMETHPLEGKYNRNCYYDTNVPPAGEKTYVDLEDQISGSKITKARTGYPMDYHPHPHHQTAAAYYDVHHPQARHPGMPYANSKYYQDPRYLYHPHQSLSVGQPPHPQATYYAGGVDGSAMGISHPSQSHLGHHMLRPHMSMQGATSSQAGFGDNTHINGKKTNVRDFLSSWNDDEDEMAGGVGTTNFGDNYSTFNGMAFQKNNSSAENMQRIQVGISIDKSTLMDSTGTMNLPDIIIDIEKQKPVIPEIDLTDDGQEEGMTASSAAVPPEERLYVLESIDVPLSELNKYKHLNVINKLPENIVPLKDNGGGGGVVESVFNESDLIHAGEGEAVKVAGDSGVENSLEFIDEIELNRDFKNDFELNVEYESFPSQVKEEVVAGEEEEEEEKKVEKEFIATSSPGESLASLAVKAEDLVAAGGQRKESVIVAMKRKDKSESGRKKKKLRKALKAQLKLLSEQRLKEEKEAGVTMNGDECEVGGLPPKSAFKSLAKCCLDVINTKEFRRNATKYLTVADVKVPCPSAAQEEPPVPRKYRYLRRFRESESLAPVLNPKSLREMCAEVVIAWNMVTIQEEGEDEEEDMDVQMESDSGMVRLIDGQVPLLRELCENVLQQTNFIINVDDFCQLEEAEEEENEEHSKQFSENNIELDDNNNNNNQNMTLISGLSPEENLEALKEDQDQQHQVEAEEEVEDFSLNPSPDAAPSAFLYHDNHHPHEDALMNCDYFLATADSDQIQFSEEVVPVDADRHKRQLLTEQLRAKYVHNPQNIHALDSRKMILKKYFYYQKHVAMVRRWRRRRRWNGSMSCGDSFVVALRRRYQCAMRFRQKWMKKSKTILIEPTKAGEVSQRPPAVSQIVIRPRAVAAATTMTTETTTLSNNDKIMELIKGGIADMARKSAAREEHSRGTDRSDKSDTTEVIMVTVEKTMRRRDEEEEEKRRRRRRRSKSRSRSRRSSRDRKKEKYKGSREEKRKDRSEAKMTQLLQQKEKEKKNGFVVEKREKIDCHRQRSQEIEEEELVKEHQRTTPISFNESRKEEMRIRKKIKPKFDDILLGIDDIYKTSTTSSSLSTSSSTSTATSTVSMKIKPKTNLRALRAFENVDESSMSSPSSVVSSSTSSTSTSGSSSCSSASTSTSTNASKSSKSSKNTTTTSDSEVSRSLSSSSSSSSGSTVRRSMSSSSGSSSSGGKSRKCGSKGTKLESESKRAVNQSGRPLTTKTTTTTTTKVNVVRVKSSKLTITAAAAATGREVEGGGPRVEKKRKSEADLMVSLKEKLIIKKAVVQLERDGYIDKLGKLYT